MIRWLPFKSPRSEGMGQIVVLSDSAAKTREIGEGSVSREGQYQQNRADRHVIEDTSAGDRSQEHGKHTLITGQARVRGFDAVCANQVSNPGEQHNQESDDDG
jgi:hypothetical protein